MARYSANTLAVVNLGLQIEGLASQAFCASSRIEGKMHSRLRGNAIGASVEQGKAAQAKLEQALELVLAAMALLNIDEEV